MICRYRIVKAKSKMLLKLDTFLGVLELPGQRGIQVCRFLRLVAFCAAGYFA